MIFIRIHQNTSEYIGVHQNTCLTYSSFFRKKFIRIHQSTSEYMSHPFYCFWMIFIRVHQNTCPTYSTVFGWYSSEYIRVHQYTSPTYSKFSTCNFLEYKMYLYLLSYAVSSNHYRDFHSC